MNIFPKWFNLAFALKHPYRLVETDEGFEIAYPNGKVWLSDNGKPIKIEGDVPDDLKKLESRQLQLVHKEVPDKFLVVGAGGVGSWFLISMVAVNPQAKFIVFDDDRLEETNLERIPFPPSYISMLKTDAIKSWVQVIYQRGSSVISVPHKFRTEFFEHLVFKPDVVVECSDDYLTQRSTFEYCTKNELPFYKIGTINNRVTISTSVPNNSWSSGTEETRTGCGVGIPQWQPTQMLAAAELTSFIMRSEFVEINLFEKENIQKVRNNEHIRAEEEAEVSA
ncbi:MAG: ThiF family adenylyltransferase [Planctomycetes bacterium]|nr:ThiF family adenylyltransferase [Planctomycetota bacterium]